MYVRYSKRLRIQKVHFFFGLMISLISTLVIGFEGFNFRIWQADIVSRVLSFAGVPHKLFIWGDLTMGPTFEVPISSQPIPFTVVILSMIVLASFTVISSFYRRIPSPVKTVALVLSLVTVFTLLWQTAISPIPSYTTHWVTLDWSCSGVISLCLITLIYVPFLFTITGPLWAKIFWLFITIGFSIVWNLVRMSLVTATLYYFGGPVFLLLHYLVGAFIDFVYIVAFYSLALSHLSEFACAKMARDDSL